MACRDSLKVTSTWWCMTSLPSSTRSQGSMPPMQTKRSGASSASRSGQVSRAQLRQAQLLPVEGGLLHGEVLHRPYHPGTRKLLQRLKFCIDPWCQEYADVIWGVKPAPRPMEMCLVLIILSGGQCLGAVNHIETKKLRNLR